LDDKENGRTAHRRYSALFYDIEELTVKAGREPRGPVEQGAHRGRGGPDKGLVVARAFEPLSKAVVKQIAELGVTKIKVVDTTVDDGIVIKCLKKDPDPNEEEALKDIYRRLRPGRSADRRQRPGADQAAVLRSEALRPGPRGPLQDQPEAGPQGQGNDSRILTKEDLVAATKYLLRLKKGEGTWTTLTTWAAAGCAPWANCSPTSAAWAWPAPSAWSRSA
jgi:DNA-directed RNA polymerase subunit beta